MLLTLNLDSTVWVVVGIGEQAGEQDSKIGNAQNLRHINQRKGFIKIFKIV